MDPDMLDEIRLVSEKQWRGIQEKYNKTKPIEETIGRTSAASLAIAEELDKENPNSVILVLFYDKSDRYDTLVEPHA
jgi:cysteine synthase